MLAMINTVTVDTRYWWFTLDAADKWNGIEGGWIYANKIKYIQYSPIGNRWRKGSNLMWACISKWTKNKFTKTQQNKKTCYNTNRFLSEIDSLNCITHKEIQQAHNLRNRHQIMSKHSYAAWNNTMGSCMVSRDRRWQNLLPNKNIFRCITLPAQGK